MGRPHRAAQGGLVYHVLNRANARMPLFEKDEDYQAFEKVLEEAVERTNMRLLAYCVMPNHWHLVVWPEQDEDLSRFTGWLTLTHTQRWHAHRHTTGTGHVYQGRFKSFPTQDDEHYYLLCRYLERNALRSNLVQRAEDWRWGSLYRWHQGSTQERALLSAWPLRRRPGWVDFVNQPQSEAELQPLGQSVQRGIPYGEPTWRDRMVGELGLESTLRPRGRPRQQEKGS
ncbi:transposase [Adhaeretor mobilis]|uniref:Transposase IS200 like protein n=1 Tax=Adhaeretor mobilis TaxID=1930276 RepID=A0A517N0C3_9BACT|nr:transposase [Adhaeretor mobilis]QDT00590.1 Transposase IS200 like protein [Adhaeretor mobilis]